MKYCLIEGKNEEFASEYLLHKMLWSTYTTDPVNIIPCEGNQNLYQKLSDILSNATDQDSVYIAYDIVNASTAKGVSLISDMIELIHDSSISCYFFTFDCFELALFATGVPVYLLEYASKFAVKEKHRLDCSRLLDIIKDLNSEPWESLDLEALRTVHMNCQEFLRGSIEQVIKRLCNLACNSGHSGFHYSVGQLGTCWHQDCSLQEYCALSNCKQLQDKSHYFCSPICNSKKPERLMSLWGATSILDLYLPVSSG